jgi:TPR repeat protein
MVESTKRVLSWTSPPTGGNPAVLVAAAHAWSQGPEPDTARATELFEAAWSKRSSSRAGAAYWLARSIGEDDPARAIELMSYAHANGRRGVAKELATRLEQTQPEDPRIETLWRQAAAEGDPWAGLAVFRLYGDRRALNRAIKEFTTRHQNGSDNASIDLARIYGTEGLAPNAEDHEYWLKQAAERSVLGASMYGQLLVNNVESPNSVGRGIAMLERAASLGNSTAMFMLGRMYLYGGNGIDADPERAIGFLAAGATAGSPAAMHVYSRALFGGIGGPAEPQKD